MVNPLATLVHQLGFLLYSDGEKTLPDFKQQLFVAKNTQEITHWRRQDKDSVFRGEISFMTPTRMMPPHLEETLMVSGAVLRDVKNRSRLQPSEVQRLLELPSQPSVNIAFILERKGSEHARILRVYVPDTDVTSWSEHAGNLIAQWQAHPVLGPLVAEKLFGLLILYPVLDAKDGYNAVVMELRKTGALVLAEHSPNASEIIKTLRETKKGAKKS
jgi:hypothetical protein